MTSSFEKAFPFLVEIFQKENSIQGIIKELLEKKDYQKALRLIHDITRFEISKTSPAAKTTDLLSIITGPLMGLTPMEFLNTLKIQLKISFLECLKDENQSLEGVEEEDKYCFYLLKWDKLLKDFFTELIRKESKKLSGAALYVLFQTSLIDMKWNDGELLDDLFGVKRFSKGFMNLVKKEDNPNEIALEKKRDASLIFSDGETKLMFSVDLKFTNNRPFYKFPPMITYEEMDIIAKYWLNDFPFERMLGELTN